ncbi:MAG TPA: 50S ribosomal protein L11 methyltransferase [Gemmatimonadales bacterium]|jgi:ribosomal protein L11 methyltransferase|nr:50S ribosomal protein L11 methyltransferase [Gemmatimonadales bacterium]
MTQQWWRISVDCRPEDTDAVAAALVAATGQGVEEPADGRLLTVETSEENAKRVVGALVASFPALEGIVTPLDPVDWSVKWRDGIITRRFGRLVVTPSWLPVVPADNEVLVSLDPESAFGSGEHGSTRAAMTLLERHLKPGDRVLDFGSGSGILAIAAAQLGAVTAIGIEVDDESHPIAEANAEKNGVTDRVTFLVGDAAELGVLAGPAEVLCSNILRTVNTLLLPAIQKALVPGGVAIFAGMEDMEEELFRPVLQRAGFTVIDDVHDAGWWGVAARFG